MHHPGVVHGLHSLQELLGEKTHRAALVADAHRGGDAAAAAAAEEREAPSASPAEHGVQRVSALVLPHQKRVGAGDAQERRDALGALQPAVERRLGVEILLARAGHLPLLQDHSLALPRALEDVPERPAADLLAPRDVRHGDVNLDRLAVGVRLLVRGHAERARAGASDVAARPR